MNKIIEYKLVSDSNIHKVEEEVNKLIAEGFQPLGAISTSYVPEESVIYACQAMVKYKGPAKQEDYTPELV